MVWSWTRIALLIVVSVPLAGCFGGGPEPPDIPPTFPVSGIIKIDGKPTEGVRVMMFSAAEAPTGIDINLGAPHQGTTGPDGKFQITTYNLNDGAPPGDYILSFFWQGNAKVMPFANPDEPRVDPVAMRFNRKFENPSRSRFKAKVEDGKATDLGTLELSAK